MRIQNIANKVKELGGTCVIDANRRSDDSRYIVGLTGTLGVHQLEAIDYASPSGLATDADVSAISVKREGDTSYVVLRTINTLDQLAPKGVM